MQLQVVGLLFGLFVASALSKESYDGYKVIQTQPIPTSSGVTNLIRFVETDTYGAFDFWSTPRFEGSRGKIMVAPGHSQRLEALLEDNGIEYSVLIEDVEKVHQAAEMEEKLARMSRKESELAMDWDNYYDLEDIYAFMDQMSQRYPNVSVVTYGKTFEERDLKLLKIAQAGEGAPNVVIEAGIHAREWIAPSMASYIAHELLTQETNEDYLQKFNFYILPVANPDGYAFSRKRSRLWRKNRARNSGSFCRGVDANRNFDFHWSEIGVSSDPCTEIYPGESAFSEPEAKYLTDYLLTLKPAPVFIMGLHSAADLILLPYSYSHDAKPDNYDDLFAKVTKACDKLNAVHDQEFEVIHTPNLYPCGGVAHDWYVGVLGVEYAFTIELRQGGLMGFDLPIKQIKPSGEELMVGFQTMLDQI